MTRKKSSAVSGKEEKTQLHSVAMKKQHFIQGQGRNSTSFRGKEETALHSWARKKQHFIQGQGIKQHFIQGQGRKRSAVSDKKGKNSNLKLNV